MNKKNTKRPTTYLYPLPTVMVSCGDNIKKYNIITIAWTGTICSTPPMCYISIRPERHSHSIISKTKEFVVNLTTEKLIKAMDYCGIKSGRDVDKFKELNLTPQIGQIVKAPLIAESPVNIECVVKEIKPLGSHNMFISEVVAININEEYKNTADLIAYNDGKYYNLKKQIGFYGFSKNS